MSDYQVEEALAVLRRRLQPEGWHPDPLAIAGLPIGLKLDFSWAEYLSGAGWRLKRSYSVDALRRGESEGGARAARVGVERQQSESGEYDLVISGAPRRGPHLPEELGARFARGGEQRVSSFVRVVRRSSFNTPPLARAAIGKASVKRAGSQPTSTGAEVAARYSNLRSSNGRDQMNVEQECASSTPWMPIGRVPKRSGVSQFQAISEASVAPPPPPQSPSPSTRSAAAAVEERTRAHQKSARAASVPLDSDRSDRGGGSERKRPRIVFEEGAALHAFAESDPYENVLVFPGALLAARRGRPERPDPSGLAYIDSGASSATSDSARATPSPAPAQPEPEPKETDIDADALQQEEEEEKKNAEAEEESSTERDSSTLSPNYSPAHWPPGPRRQGPGPGAGPGAGASVGKGGQQDQAPAAGGSRQGQQSGSSSAPQRQREQQGNSTRLTGVTPVLAR